VYRRAVSIPSRFLSAFHRHRAAPSGRWPHDCAAFCLLLTLAAAGDQALAATRNEEIAECLPGDIATWGDGQDRKAISSPLRFHYRHAGAPPWFSETLVRKSVTRAADAWAGCGIPVQQIDAAGYALNPKDVVVVEWSEPGSRGNFGLANLGQRSLSLSPASFQLLNSRNPRYDSTQTLQMVVSHEMGHFFGLMAHSRRCVDVLSYYHDGKGGKCNTRNPAGTAGVVEYRHLLPTACDIKRCRLANGLPP
jgi:hypothetical protein